MALAAYLEVGQRRVFAVAVDWPGWCRAGKDEEAALAALAAYRDRYARVAALAGVAFRVRQELDADDLDVVERVSGNATTEFGAPGTPPALDARAVSAPQARRAADLVGASWRALGQAAQAAPRSLRKGPRGGGRDRDAIVEHVLGAEAAYARKLGVKVALPADDPAAVEAGRAQILAVLGASCDGVPLAPQGWPSRYAARRIAWHALDHAWEIEDRH